MAQILATTHELPTCFQQSCLQSSHYPENITQKGANLTPTVLRAYRARLKSASPDLFVQSEAEVDISFRDLGNVSGEEVEKRNIESSSELRAWLALDLNYNATRPSCVARKRDPQSRFIYIWGLHSRSELQITLEMLALIFTFHQVMPSYLDFISVFGAQSDSRDLRFSGFRESRNLIRSSRTPVIDSLGRSGRQFQLVYIFKGVTCKEKNQWSIRQAAIHHQFDIETGTTLWILTKGHTDLQQRYKELTGPEGREEDRSFGDVAQCLRSSFAAHLLFCQWATEDWRGYLRWLEETIESETSRAIFGRRDEGHAYQYQPQHIQDLQRWEDRTNEVIMILEANLDVLSSLRGFYKDLGRNEDVDLTLRTSCRGDISGFVALVDDFSHDVNMQIKRSKLLVKITNDRKELVLQHLQSQATNKMERLNENMERETVVMRIITVLTLIYLPATFVSTFFSTDIVKYQNQNQGSSTQDSQKPYNGSFSSLALQRWLQVTIPLTVLTLLVAWSSLRVAKGEKESIKHVRGKQQKMPGQVTRANDGMTLPFHNSPPPKKMG